VLGQRRVGHFDCQTRFASIGEGFCDILREIDVVCVAKLIAEWKFVYAQRIRIALQLTLMIGDDRYSRRYQKPHWLCFIQLLSQPVDNVPLELYCGKHCTRRSVNRYQGYPAFSNCKSHIFGDRLWKPHRQIRRVEAICRTS